MFLSVGDGLHCSWGVGKSSSSPDSSCHWGQCDHPRPCAGCDVWGWHPPRVHWPRVCGTWSPWKMNEWVITICITANIWGNSWQLECTMQSEECHDNILALGSAQLIFGPCQSKKLYICLKYYFWTVVHAACLLVVHFGLFVLHISTGKSVTYANIAAAEFPSSLSIITCSQHTHT